MKVANPFAVLPLLLVALSYYRADAIKAKSVLLELQTHFGKTNFPTEYPTGLEDSEGLDFPQFGKVAIVVHNSDYNFWKEGELAPDYLKSFLTGDRDSIAELTTYLESQKGGDVKEYFVSPGTEQCGLPYSNAKFLYACCEPGGSSLNCNDYCSGVIFEGTPNCPHQWTVTIDEAYPLITVITPVFPSPDWFTGISGYATDFAQTAPDSVLLYPLDAGLDSGTTYSSGDVATNPAEPIVSLQDATTGVFVNPDTSAVSDIVTMVVTASDAPDVPDPTPAPVAPPTAAPVTAAPISPIPTVAPTTAPPSTQAPTSASVPQAIARLFGIATASISAILISMV